MFRHRQVFNNIMSRKKLSIIKTICAVSTIVIISGYLHNYVPIRLVRDFYTSQPDSSVITHRDLMSMSINVMKTPSQNAENFDESPTHYVDKSDFKHHRLLHNRENKITPKTAVLIFTDTPSGALSSTLGQFFAQQRIDYEFKNVENDIPQLLDLDDGVPKYTLFVFSNFTSYLSMSAGRKRVLDEYCVNYGVGIVALTQSSKSSNIEFFSNKNLKIQHSVALEDFKLEPSSPLWRVGKAEAVFSGALPSQDWSVFTSNHATYRPLVYSTVSSTWQGSRTDINVSTYGCVVALHDIGLQDNIQKVILGYDLNFWLNSIVAMDAITFLTGGQLGLPLERLVQVDVDGTFVGKPGIRTKVKDVETIVKSQENIQKFIPDFQFVVGFSGGTYKSGNDEESEGDERMIDNAKKFLWYNQMFRHEQPHLLNADKIRSSLAQNKKFAEEKKIPVMSEYMVTPHHSGVYPIVDYLYDVWRALKGVVCTSTDEYPRYVPHWERRGFIYKNIMVVPRQTCRLFANASKFDDYQGGKTELDASINGGYLFKVFLFTPVMVFKTHMSNYGNDQLAQYSFEHVVDFVSRWTNLRLQASHPAQLAKRYFELYPQETSPIWTNPCDDARHMNIWHRTESCNQFPAFVIIGPQKTGTTALLTFLKAHPGLQTTSKDPVYYEEVQFFNEENYKHGIGWYMKRFENATKGTLQFEKSANYFDSEEIPARMAALLPNAKIITILADPVRRAYSWYQHHYAHHNPIVVNHTFYEVVTATEKSPKRLFDFRLRCLNPGEYARHLERWLKHYPRDQIFIVDGSQLNQNPVPIMNKLQEFLGVSPFKDYNKLLRFGERKGFYCLVDQGCLGVSKGRKYAQMDDKSKQVLQQYFAPHNRRLQTLLTELNQSHPSWLLEQTT